MSVARRVRGIFFDQPSVVCSWAAPEAAEASLNRKEKHSDRLQLHLEKVYKKLNFWKPKQMGRTPSQKYFPNLKERPEKRSKGGAADALSWAKGSRWG
jgi:hypothetical protein